MDFNYNSVTNMPTTNYDYLNKFGTNPLVLMVLIIIIVIYYFLFSSLGNNSNTPFSNGNNGESKNSSLAILEALLWGIFIVLILLNGMAYFFNINIVGSIKNLFTDLPEVDIKVDSDLDNSDGDPIPEIKLTHQVFNIPGNEYTYEDAKALCKAYGSRLATYKELEDAYEDGADWCNFGWSDNQMALYPTNMEKWKKLQKIKGHEHDCGRPGINGGYIENPNVRFGANCFGYKPKINQKEEDLMKNSSPYPKTKDELAFDKQVEYWRQRLSTILVSPFNNKNWSTI
jgi:hypothetical protein